MGSRAELAAGIAAALPEPTKIRILEYPDQVDPAATETDATVVVVRKSIAPAPQAPLGAYVETFALWLIDPNEDREVSENNLDDQLDIILAALETLPWLAFSIAERDTFGRPESGDPAYRIDVTLFTKNQKEQPA